MKATISFLHEHHSSTCRRITLPDLAHFFLIFQVLLEHLSFSWCNMVDGAMGYLFSFFQRDSAILGLVGRQFSQQFFSKDFWEFLELSEEFLCG
jgi:hypothetical protein